MSQPTDPGRLLLVDGHSLAYRAFFALPVGNFSTTDGQPTNAVYGFTSMLINTLRDEKPTHVAVAFDVSRKTFRTDVFPEYKANRVSSPTEFKGQVDLIGQVLEAMGIVSLKVDGFEADDIIATLATAANADGIEVLILSGDRDSFQLINESTTVLYPKRGVSDLARMGPTQVEEKYGLTPAQYADFAALRGDPSDNLPSIPSVGDKTAAKWIREYGDLTNLLENADQIGGKVGESLRANVGQVRNNRELTELVKTMDLGVTLPELALSPFEPAKVHEVFDALEFRVLRERIFDLIDHQRPGGDSSGDGDFDGELLIATGDGQVAAWLGQQAGAGSCSSLVVEGRWGAGTGDCWGIAVATSQGAALWFDPTALGNSDEVSVADWLASPDVHKVMHGAKGQLLALAARGWELKGLVGDTELSAYLVQAGSRSFGIEDLVQRFLRKSLAPGSDLSGQLSLTTDDGESAQTLAREARAIYKLAGVLNEQVTARGGEALLRDVELPLVPLLAKMERAGIALDVDYLRVVQEQYSTEIIKNELLAHELAGREFNLGSPKQLQEILFGELGLPKTKKTKTGFTTDADALAGLAAKTDHPLLGVLLRWREVTKLRQTVAGLLPLTDAQDRIHTTFQQTVAATGRLSSTDPNLQNIPIRTEEGRRIRSGFVVGAGFEALLTADYSQIEMRIMAHLSGDEQLIQTFQSGEDLHSTMASAVFGVRPDLVNAQQRRRIKAMSYGLAYGLSAFGLSAQLGIGAAEARALMDEYFARFGGVRDYLAEAVNVARETGYTETILGRRRYLPDLTSDNRQRREMAERMALNAPIQGSAADLVKVAMLRVEHELERAEMKTRLLLQVHDELVLEVGPGETEAATEIVSTQMASAADLRVPLAVSIGLGRTWHDAAH